MQKQYASQGLVVTSLALDSNDPQKPTIQKGIRDFLGREKATFRNVVLAEGDDVLPWEDRWAPNGLPARWVYDRDGKSRRFDGGSEENLKAMEDYVKEQLARK